jgi:hypothetical protein
VLCVCTIFHIVYEQISNGFIYAAVHNVACKKKTVKVKCEMHAATQRLKKLSVYAALLALLAADAEAKREE